VSARLHRLGALARRDLAIEISYHFRLGLFLTGAFVSAFLAFYVSKLVGEPEALERFEGSYFDYVVIGLALTSYAGLGVVAFTAQISREQAAGTLEVLLSGPTRLGTLLAGGLLVPLGLTTIEVALLVGMGVGVVGVGLSMTGVALAVPVVLLTVVNFCAMGIASAALVLLVKRGDPVSGPAAQVVLLLSGAIFPVELFPGWLQALCRANPAYYGVRGLHEALLTDGGFTGLLDELAVLAAFACITLPLSLWCFSRSVAKAKHLGVLANY
jgi:ABC-2 type transport system permease protein